MLVVSQKKRFLGCYHVIGVGRIFVWIHNHQIKVGFDVPKSVKVLRDEVVQRLVAEDLGVDPESVDTTVGEIDYDRILKGPRLRP